MTLHDSSLDFQLPNLCAVRHLARHVRQLGPLRYQDTAPFEAAIGCVKKTIRKTNRVDMERQAMMRLVYDHASFFIFRYPNCRSFSTVLADNVRISIRDHSRHHDR